MALSWTQDRLGPICRYAEDTAIVMQAIAKPDGRDLSVTDVPFNWPVTVDLVLNATFLDNAQKEAILSGNLMRLLRIT